MIICSFVKMISIYTPPQTRIRKKNYSVKIATIATHRDSYIQETTSNLPHGACIIIHTHTHTHTKNHLHDHTYVNIIHTHTHKHTHTHTHTHNPNLLLTVYLDFFRFLKYLLSLPDYWRIKTAWNQWSETCINAI